MPPRVDLCSNVLAMSASTLFSLGSLSVAEPFYLDSLPQRGNAALKATAAHELASRRPCRPLA